MEILFVLAALWRHKLVVALGVVVALAAGVVVAARPARGDAGAIAWTRVILDTPRSQLLDATVKATETLPWRAQMLTDLMKSEPIERQLAAGMGVPVKDVDVVVTTPEDQTASAPIQVVAGKAAALAYAPYVVTPLVPNPTIPMIALSASAPDAAAAKRLVTVAVDVLRRQDTKPGPYVSKFVTGREPVFEAFSVIRVSPVQTKSVATALSPLIPVAVALIVLSLWCTAVVFVVAPITRWRVGRARYVVA